MLFHQIIMSGSWIRFINVAEAFFLFKGVTDVERSSKIKFSLAPLFFVQNFILNGRCLSVTPLKIRNSTAVVSFWVESSVDENNIRCKYALKSCIVWIRITYISIFKKLHTTTHDLFFVCWFYSRFKKSYILRCI